MKISPIGLGALASALLLGAIGFATSGSRNAAVPRPAGAAPSAIAYAAPTKPAPRKSTAPAAAPKATSPSARASAAGEPGDAARQAFVKVVEAVKQKIAAAPANQKEKAAKDGLARLQQYAAAHAREPIGEVAKLTAANLQFQLGQTGPAIAAFRQVAAHPIDKKAGLAAQLTLAQMLVQTEKSDEAQQVLNQIISKNEDPEATANAQLHLAGMLAQGGKADEAEKLLQQVVAKNQVPELTAAAKQGLDALSIRPGRKPPEFSVKDTAGSAHSLGTYQGKVLLIDFWATWCVPCREELPNVKKAYSQFKDRGFTVLGISLDRQRSDLDAFVKEQGIEWPQVFAGSQELAQRYGVTGIPRMLLLDREGVIRYVDPRGPALEPAVAALVGGDKAPDGKQ